MEVTAKAVPIQILIWKKRSALSDLLLTTKEVHGTGTSSLLLLSQTDLKQLLLFEFYISSFNLLDTLFCLISNAI